MKTAEGRGERQVFRRVLVAVAATLLAATAVAAPPLHTDAYFLSATNPLATADQRDLEAQALQLLRTPEMQKAREIARMRWKTIVRHLEPDAEAWGRFDAFLDEFMMHYALKAANSDPERPRILRYNMLSHTWFGHTVPGSRQAGGDNVDNTYALIPVERGAAYEIEVQRLEPHPTDVTWSLMGDLIPMMTLGILEGRDMVTGPDGRFTVTIDDTPANGRPNHIQTQPDTRYLFIRETRSDWRQVPSAMRVKRITPARLPALTPEQLAARAGRYAVAAIPDTYWWSSVVTNNALNSMTPPVAITGLGGLVTQQTSFGHARLGDDDALVVTVGSGGAAYFSFETYDFWFNAIDYAQHQSSLNNAQAVPNADGTTTYVVSLRDPGVHNWIDPGGVHFLLLLERWQGLPRDAGAHPPTSMNTRLVKLSELDTVLPAGTRRVTAAERQRQLEQRRAEHALRFAQ